jgi:hypothetical protein
MEETPGHGADVVEELQGSGCVSAMRGVREAEDSKVNVHFLRGSIGNPEVMEPVSSGSSVTLREIRWNR